MIIMFKAESARILDRVHRAFTLAGKLHAIEYLQPMN